MATILLAAFFLTAGLLFLFWPERLRDTILKSYAQIDRTKPVPWQQVMFAPGYILSQRIGGVLSICVSLFLIWLYFLQPI